ncbi:electron transport complex subunit RsxC [Dysgonomonas reticulitermitis]
MMHIFSMKGKTKEMLIQPLADAPFLYMPLLKYAGSVPVPIVKIGDAVRQYQLIAQIPEGAGWASNVHSPVSGIVHDIKEYPQADGQSLLTIVIKNDFKETKIEYQEEKPEYTPEQIIDLIEKAGVAGEGGAQFPTATKYRLEGRHINTFIINGAECEPYLTADYALMAERTEKLFQGINILNSILQAEDIVIAIEEQNKELQKIFSPFLRKKEFEKIRVFVLPNEYPQGGELQLIKSVTGIEIRRNQRPRDAGVIVNNVGTIDAVYEAVVNRKPVISRIITISGERSEYYGNFEVKIGTPIGHILNLLGLTTNNKTIVLGGPMMGKAITDWSIPVTKGSGGVLFLKKEKFKRSNCISCGYCVDVCPMRLMPMKFEEYFRRGKYFNLEKYSISSCIECAACEYICPSNVPLIESIKEGKMKLKQLANAIQ